MEPTEIMRAHSADRLTPKEIAPEVARVASKTIVNNQTVGTTDYARGPIDTVVGKLGSNITTGLSADKASEILGTCGSNELEKPPTPGFVKLFMLQLINFVIVLLIVAACASMLVAATGSNRDDPLQYTTGIAIFLLILVNAGIAAKTEAQANGALDALAKMSQASVKAIRDGKEVPVKTVDLVPGDILLLTVGDVVPADVRLIEAMDFKVNEMPLTGEPDDVGKTHKVKELKAGETPKLVPDTCAFSGCMCTNGKCKAVVTETGMDTRIGKIARLLQGESSGKKKCGCCPDTSAGQTPLQANVEKLGARIGVLAIGVCVIVWIIGVVMQRVPIDYNPEDDKMVSSVIYMILIAVTLAVAAIPEGIPLCVTISLSIGCKNMVAHNVLVRKLAAVETLGSASVICTDKTGTLTEGKMTMVHCWTSGRTFDVSGKGFNPKDGTITERLPSGEAGELGAGVKDPAVRSMLCAGLLCSNTKLKQNKDGQWEPEGNSSEAPIVVAARKVGFDEDQAAKDYERVMEVPFSSSRKMMLTVSKMPGTKLGEGGIQKDSTAGMVSVCKGAPNFILNACQFWLNGDGDYEPLQDDKKKEILDIVDKFSSMALRVLAIGVVLLPELPYDDNDDELSTDVKFLKCREGLSLLGLVASIDPERDGVPQAVITARGASIRVVMITGDYLKTAVAIGHNCNILVEGDDDQKDAVDCGDLRPKGEYLTNDEIDLMTARVKVFARAQPEDKLEIVKSLQRQDCVCAMTGDGVNDAPALKRADIGVAMGIQGTEVAKGAADMVLMDDNFANIVTAVEKGRIIYSGIQKFVAFIMSVHIAEVLQIFVCVIVGMPLMRSPLQILFLILVTDLPPSIALGMEPGEPGILNLAPRPKSEPIVLDWMWLSMIVNGAILSAVIVGVYVVSLMHYCDGAVLQSDIDIVKITMGAAFVDKAIMQAQTVAFISLVYSENIRAYISRSFDKPVWTKLCANVAMQYSIALAQIALYIAIFLPGLSDKILKLNGLEIGAWGWGVACLGPLGTLALCEMYKVVTYFQIRTYNKKLEMQRRREELDKQQAMALEVAQKQKEELIQDVIRTNSKAAQLEEVVRVNSQNGQFRPSQAAQKPAPVEPDTVTI